MHTEEVLDDRQKNEDVVLCEGKALKNSYKFKYLGSMFTADGTDEVDIRRRVGMAVSRCGQLRFVLGAENIKLRTKMQIYKSAVGSLFTYGSEAWNLSEKNLRALNGANAGCLQRFTGRTRVEEAREISCTYSLCKDIRRRRMSWLGHILRMKKYKNENGEDVDRLVKIAVKVQHEMGGGGSLLMDAPAQVDFEDLEALAENRIAWKQQIEKTFGKKCRKIKRTKKPASQRSSHAGRTLGRWVGNGAQTVWIGPDPCLLRQETSSDLITATETTTTRPIYIPATNPAKTAQTQLEKYWQRTTTGTESGKHSARIHVLDCKKKPSKAKTTKLSDAQRAAWAHAHFIIHHGTKEDAKRFMLHPKNIKNTPADALTKVRKMAAQRFPTWEEAKAAVFSSSSSDESDDTARTPTNLSATTTYKATTCVPTWEVAKAAVFSSSSSAESTGWSTEARPQTGGHQKWDTSTDGTDTNTARISTNLAPAATAHNVAKHPDNSTAPAKPNLEQTIESNKKTNSKGYRTRSKTSVARAQAAAARDERKVTPPTIQSKRARKRRSHAKPSKRPKRVRIAPSQIPGAGLGLYIEEDVRAGEWIARYSGEPLTQEECESRPQSHYRLQIHRNLYLDAAGIKHFEGRYINDARNTKFKVNARFAAGYRTNTCSGTGFTWVRIYATKPIKAGEEIFLNYGAAFWKGMQQNNGRALSHSLANNTTTTTTSASAQSSSAWAAPAYIPSDTQDQDDMQHEQAATTQQNSSTTPPLSRTWSDLTPTPSSPMLLGHFKHTNQQHIQDSNHHTHQPPLHFSTPLSPIRHGPTSKPTIHLNENYSIHQVYTIGDIPYDPTPFERVPTINSNTT